jgi:predicted methyltransferase
VEVPRGAGAAGAARILAQRDRREEDRALDRPRQAEEVLAYLEVAPGMNVAVLAAGAGYFMELIARSVGLNGRIFARNPPSLLAENGLDQAWNERLAAPAGARVIRIDEELGRPLAVDGLDLVFLDLDYAIVATRGGDSAAVNAVAWNALRQGGRFVVVEREGDLAQARQTIESHGFHLAGEGRFLRPGANPTDWSLADARLPPPVQAGASGENRVFLTFVKP